MSNGDREQARRLFNTRSHSWREAGLARQLSRRAVKRARIQALVTVPLLVPIVSATFETPPPFAPAPVLVPV